MLLPIRTNLKHNLPGNKFIHTRGVVSPNPYSFMWKFLLIIFIEYIHQPFLHGAQSNIHGSPLSVSSCVVVTSPWSPNKLHG